jgi:transcriptional regulator with GAF, ATPase, and Fis domain
LRASYWIKGAFTDAKTDRAGRFELADESTLFMDEIANIPLLTGKTVARNRDGRF